MFDLARFLCCKYQSRADCSQWNCCKARRLTRDHCPTDPEERKRIIEAGGIIISDSIGERSFISNRIREIILISSRGGRSFISDCIGESSFISNRIGERSFLLSSKGERSFISDSSGEIFISCQLKIIHLRQWRREMINLM